MAARATAMQGMDFTPPGAAATTITSGTPQFFEYTPDARDQTNRFLPLARD